MAKHILRCEKCNTYTMKDVCDKCGAKTVIVRPPKYSPEDRFAKYRRQAKFESEDGVE